MVSNNWSCISLHSLKKHSGGESRRQKTLNPVKQLRFSLGVLVHPTFPCRIPCRPFKPANETAWICKWTENSKFFIFTESFFFLPPAGSHHLPSEMASLERSQNPPCWCSNIPLVLAGAWAHSGERVRNISICCFHGCLTSVFLHFKKHIHCLEFNSGFRLFDWFLWPFHSKTEP